MTKRRAKRRHTPGISPAQRQARWTLCARYIRRTRSLGEAQALARKDHVCFDTAVWLSAMGKLLRAGGKAAEEDIRSRSER